MESRILEACRDELARQIAPRAQILDAGSSGSHRCELLLERSGEQSGRARLVVDLSPSHPCLYLARPIGAMPVNDQLRRLLVGMWIVAVDRPTAGPLLRLLLTQPGKTEAERWLVLEWLGGSPAAVVVDAASGQVLMSVGELKGAGRARRERGATYHWPSSPHKPPYDRATAGQVEAFIKGARDVGAARALARGFSGLPSFLAVEAIHRGGQDPAALADALRAIATEPFAPRAYIASDPHVGLPPAFVSPIPLVSSSPYEAKNPGGLFRLLEQTHEGALRAEETERLGAAWLRILSREEARLVRLHERLAAEVEEASLAPELRRKAEALLVHVGKIPRGAREFMCPDPSDPSRMLTIALDPRLGAAANADSLFRRARRLERGESLRGRRIRALEEAIARLAPLRARDGSTPKLLAAKGGGWLRGALGAFAREETLAAWGREVSAPWARAVREDRSASSREHAADADGAAGRRGTGRGLAATREDPTFLRRSPNGRPGAERFRPRSFRTRDGWMVLVGRSNLENDYITHRLAKPDDYWFHVHGCPGSHVVLRREGRGDNPSARTIEEVASITAFFSRARTSRKVPVIYTLKKYVRKARGGSPGLAIVTRERTIMVAPKAPPDAGPAGWGDEERAE